MELKTVLTECAPRVAVEQLDVDHARNTAHCARQIMARYPKFTGLVIDAKSFHDVRGLSLPSQTQTVLWASSAVDSIFDALCLHLAPNAHVAVISSQLGVATTLQMSEAQRSSLLQHQGLSLEDILKIAEQFVAEHAQAARSGGALPSRNLSNSWHAIDKEGFAYTLLHALVLSLNHRNSTASVFAIACMTGRNLDAEEATAIASLMTKSSMPLGGRLYGNNGSTVPWIADGYNRIAWSETSAALKRAPAMSLR